MRRRWRFAPSVDAARAKLFGRSQVEFRCTESPPAPPVGGKAESGPLLPGKPIALGLCRYGPVHSRSLEASRLLTRRDEVQRVVEGLNQLPTMADGVYSVPNDNGSLIVIHAFYRRSQTLVVRVGLSGALTVSRDGVFRWGAPGGGQFIHSLEALTR